MHKRTMLWRGMTALLAASAFCVSGCQTHHPYSWPAFTLSDPGWKVWNGQAVWQPRKSMPELTGDVMLALNSDGSAFIQFTKTLPFAMARVDGRRWQIEFPGRRVYKGHYPLPRYFAWLQLPAMAQGQPPGKGWSETGPLDSFELRSSFTGETLHGYLTSP